MARPFTPPRLYPILDTAVLQLRGISGIVAAQAVLDAGAQILQYRHKSDWTQTEYDEAAAVAEMARAAGALFVLNDRADFAKLLGAALHIGQDDLQPLAAREVIGDAILGFSTHNRAQLVRATDEDVEYLSIGPIFATTSKQNPDPVVGLDGLRKLRPLSKKPVVAIGGITLDGAQAVLEAGADSVAVISALFPEQRTAKAINAQVSEWLKRAQPHR